MDLVDAFPEDPFQPTILYAAKSQLPVAIPWTNETIKLGLAFDPSVGDVRLGPGRSAFLSESLKQSTLIFTSSCRGRVDVASSSGTSQSSQHVNLSITGKMGCSWAGASGRGNYEKNACEDSNSVKSSLRFDYRGGVVTFAQTPQLSSEALTLLTSNVEPHGAFREQFGDYYVGAYSIGGNNASMLSGSTLAAISSEDLSAQFEARLLLLSRKDNIEHHKGNKRFDGAISVTSFDSLDMWQCNRTGYDEITSTSIIQSATENKIRGSTITHRVTERLQEMGIMDGCQLSWEICDNLCKAGLVVELILLPYTGLKSYVAAVLSPRL